MTKEELDEEAEEFTDSKKSFWRQGRTCIDSVKQAYIAGAEPREKRIAELEAYNEKLLDGDIEKHNKIVELKEQVDALANVNIKAQNIIGKAKEIICLGLRAIETNGKCNHLFVEQAEQFLKECE